MGARLRQSAGQLGDAVAVRSIRGVDDYHEISWRELDRQSEALANELLKMDVDTQPATIVIITRDAVMHAIFAYGAWKAGQTILCVSPGLGPTEGKTILSRLDRTISLGAELEWDSSERVKFEEVATDQAIPMVDDRTPDPMLLLASGGSTGIPKLVDVLGAGKFVPGDFLGGLGTALKRRPRARAFVMTPLSHGAGAATAYMATFEECETSSLEKFDAEAALWAIDRFQLEQITLVPTMMDRMFNSPNFDPEKLNSIRSLCHTGMHIDPEVKKAWIDALGAEKIVEVWGSTESVGHAVISGDEWLEHRGSVGIPVNCDVRILDAAGQDLPHGEVGEIFVKPKVGNVDPATKYVGSTEKMKSVGEYVSFGDLGYLDEDGYLYIAGRTDDLIISGGANIYPDEIEIPIRRLAGVADCVVVARAHPDLGSAVHAVIALEEEGEPYSLAQLNEELSQHVSKYKLPKSVEYIDKIQRSDAGKVRRGSYRTS